VRMPQPRKKYETFKHGSVWLKADFHLHTKADKEFTYSGEDNAFVGEYIAQLKNKNISVGVITNHNKFEQSEYTALSKNARKEEILLLPGVELSVNDGANGIHVLVMFSQQWLEGGNDYINPFISSMFPGKATAEYEQENGRSDKNLLSVIEELDKVNRDYFLVFAHVEQRSGLWQEMKGGKISDIATKRYSALRQRTLGFQKVRTHDDRVKVKQWLGGWYPAEVEGSDAKTIAQLGNKKEETWLKLGDYTFEAVKYALADHCHRVSSSKPTICQRSFIKNIAFEGGILNGQQVDFSSELNALIGIRGSGKSSVLEAVRFALDIPFGDKTIDITYKNSLVAHTLASGGKVTLQAIDKYGQEYTIKRRLNEQAEVFVNDVLQPGITIRETVIHKPIYFGQKDLSSTGEGFEKDLVEKLVGEKLNDIRAKIIAQNQVIDGLCQRLLKLGDIDDKISETQDKKQDAEFRLKIFKDNGIDEKLKQQTDFDTDQRKIGKVLTDIKSFEEELTDLLDQHEDELKNHTLYKSKQNEAFFIEFLTLYQQSLSSFDKVKAESNAIRQNLKVLAEKLVSFTSLKKEQSDKFAQIRQKLEEDLKIQGKTLNLEEFPQLQSKIETSTQLLSAYTKESKKEAEIKRSLIIGLSNLNELWHDEFKIINAELSKVNDSQKSLQISCDYKGDKTQFLEQFQSIYKGSRIRANTFETQVNNYADFTAIYNNINFIKTQLTSSIDVFEQYFMENLSQLLTWQVPNKFVIKFHDKELQHHSLGQRASALILFVLSQKDNDVVIIDQPEDDLDNQTIYNDVIKLIRKIKPEIQFIFATHNANFPVLGDAEQVHACRYSDDKITLKSGSIDSPNIQQEIVDIMEGGEDAFNKRKEIYQIWKPQN